MKKLIFLSLTISLLFSCTKEESNEVYQLEYSISKTNKNKLVNIQGESGSNTIRVKGAGLTYVVGSVPSGFNSKIGVLNVDTGSTTIKILVNGSVVSSYTENSNHYNYIDTINKYAVKQIETDFSNYPILSEEKYSTVINDSNFVATDLINYYLNNSNNIDSSMFIESESIKYYYDSTSINQTLQYYYADKTYHYIEYYLN